MGQGLKIDGWQERLGITFIYYRSQPFLWGKTDCWCFASDFSVIIPTKPTLSVFCVYLRCVVAFA